MTLFFYDLETSGINPRTSRIMQFAGQRTDDRLQPIGKPYNTMVKLSEDVLPDPDAILITGITPQQTIEEGITEAEFAKLFLDEIVSEDTVFVGFNNIRFDDEFIRFLLYRNFCDSYEWQWKNGRTKWDLLDVVRMTRALRPAGIKWPSDAEGRPSNQLVLLTKINNLSHEAAHEALSDVMATIEVAKLLKSKQPKLFDYLLSMRKKDEVAQLVTSGKPFVYTSGKYPSEFEKTTVVLTLGEHPGKQGVLVYDLRHDPTSYLKMEPAQLAKLWKYDKEKKTVPLPIKTLQFNRCPAVAPLSVLDEDSQNRLYIDLNTINKHYKILQTNYDFIKKLHAAISLLNKERSQQAASTTQTPVDGRLYDGFIADKDKALCAKLRGAKPEEMSELGSGFVDERLKKLLPLYKARNFSKHLTDSERDVWEQHRKDIILGGGEDSRYVRFSRRLYELSQQPELSSDQRYLLEELHLYGESIVPEF